MHQEHLQLFGIVNQKLVETIGKQVSRSLVRTGIKFADINHKLIDYGVGERIFTESDSWLRDCAFKSSSNSGINTFLLAPR